MIGASTESKDLRRELLGPALVLAAIVAVELVTRFFVRIPNPPAILLIVVVFATLRGGLRSGLISAALAWAYFVWSFSSPGQLFRYSPDDFTRVVVWAAVNPLMVVVVAALRSRAFVAERAALQRAHELFTKTLNVSPVGVVLTRLSDGRILDANEAFLDAVGFERDELVGKTTLETKLWTSPANRDEIVGRLRAGGRVRNVDLEARSKHGEPVYFLCAMESMTIGAEACILSFAVDLTERRRAAETLRRKEEQLLQTQKMEAVGRLAGGIAHDFNNLLTVIGGNASLLADTVQDPEAREMIDEVVEAAERAAALTRQLLAFSRQEPLEPKPVDLGEVVAKLEPFLARTIGTNVTLSTVLAPTLGSVLADLGQLDQVITNLVINARDAMVRGGKLTIATRNVTLGDREATALGGQSRAGSFVVLSVKDTGEGMGKATLSLIFEPFFTTKAVGRGTGLGLATVYGIVAQSHGFVTVTSSQGAGTTFEVYLPRLDEATLPRGADAVDTTPKGSERILLVEDDLAVRALTARVLRGLGYTVIVTEDTKDAIAIAGRHPGPIDLVLTDVVMPDMNGRELAERLAPILPKAKVLFVSGYPDDARLDENIRTQAVAFLPKPFTRDMLARKVRGVLDGTDERASP